MDSMAVEIGVWGGLVPATVAVATWFTCRWVLPASARERYAGALALAVAFGVGYVLFPEWAELVPTRHWQWLPYLCGIGAVLAPIGMAAGISRIERGLLHAILAGAAAWLLVPDWSDMQPARHVQVALLGGYLFLLISLLDLLPTRLSSGLFMLSLAIVASAVAGLISAFVSLKYGQVAGLAAAALLGYCCVGSRRVSPEAVRAVVPIFVVAVGGAAFVGAIEPDPPMYALLLVPAAPLTLWLFAAGPLARLGTVPGAAAQAIAVFVPVAAAVIWLLINEQAGSDLAY
jgi:hypothetical protein